MPSDFLLYGSTGFVGREIARLAVQRGFHPLIAGRNAARLAAQATELGVEHRVFRLDEPGAIDSTLKTVKVVLHCAGPYIYTSKPMVDACLRTGAHYLDITGEIPVYAALAGRDAEAKARGVMLLPGVGFDVVPTDCLALYLKQRLPSAMHLTLAFHSKGPAGLPPGTANTAIELSHYGLVVRRNGVLQHPPEGEQTRMVDFGHGPVKVTRLTWGDVFMAYFSTGIPNIEVYSVLSSKNREQMALLNKMRFLLKSKLVRKIIKRSVKAGSTADERAKTHMSVWGEVKDDQGKMAAARLQGPEAGVVWTANAALAVVKKVLDGNVSAGFQTPASAYGADLVMECEGVTREELV
jgi:short subunit dehydrogenase-like uncharacterized protein